MSTNAPGNEVSVALGARSYAIHVGAGIMDAAASYAAAQRGGTAVIVTNETIAPLYLQRLIGALRPLFPEVQSVCIPDGEAFKTWETLQMVVDAMVAARCERGTTVFALGGGVVGDIAGFAAACYMRGVALVQVPTTLLAQVDSSVGGKTGINHPAGKNLIGAFHQPIAVVADVALLDTLPDRELSAGLAEIIKIGAIADVTFLDWLETAIPALLDRDRAALMQAVSRSCALKAQIVAADERESGLRAVLNFGHTFGHAIETGLGHGTWLHGEAVACGMAMAADLSCRLGLLERAFANRLARILGAAKLPLRAPALGAQRYLDLMHIDKKAEGGRPRFVVLEAPGRAALRAVEERLVAETIQEFGG